MMDYRDLEKEQSAYAARERYEGTAPMANDVREGSSNPYGSNPYHVSAPDKTVAYRVPAVRTRRIAREERDAARARAEQYAPEVSRATSRMPERPSASQGRPRRGASGLRWLARIVCLGMLVFGLMTVYYLTEQTVGETSSLSGLAQGIAEREAMQVQSGLGHSARLDPVKWAAERVLLVSYKLSNHGLDIRHQAHVVQFALVGGVVALNVLAWMSGWAHRRDAFGRIHGSRTMLMLIVSLGLSAAASFADQFHKLYVPGRHFDTLDLVLDACGYVGAIVAVFVVWSVVSALYRLVFRK